MLTLSFETGNANGMESEYKLDNNQVTVDKI